MTNKVVVSLLIAFLVFVISIFGYVQGFFTRPELFVYDMQARAMRAEKVADKHVKVVLVDEAALKAMNNIAGRWPWPRAIWSARTACSRSA